MTKRNRVAVRFPYTSEPARVVAMDFLVWPHGAVELAGRRVPCALGRNRVHHRKVEGDGATPAGRFALRTVYFRPDRVPLPQTRLPVKRIAPTDGWCDDPEDPRYNRPITLPDSARHEVLWREDRLYDLLVVIGYNDAPVTPGLGSAIFLHIASPGYQPTEGCVALAQHHLQDLLRLAVPGDHLRILGPAGPRNATEMPPA